MSEDKIRSRRALLKYGLATLGSLLGPIADVAPRSEDNSYQTVHSRKLGAGGVGLFIVVAAGSSTSDLKGLGERLRAEFRAEPNVVVEIFDDVEAANTVLAGSRTVGEESFAAAKRHQLASYVKSDKARRNSLAIYGDAPEIVAY